MKEQDFIFFEQQRHVSDSLLPLVPSRDKQTHTNLSGFPESASQVRGRRLQYSLRGHPYKCATWLHLYLKKAKILGASVKAQTPVCAMIRVKISCVKSGVLMCGCPLPGDEEMQNVVLVCFFFSSLWYSCSTATEVKHNHCPDSRKELRRGAGGLVWRGFVMW